ncbi:MAG: hypothetical protein V7605_1840 [Acidimicrobiaceae bacterium]
MCCGRNVRSTSTAPGSRPSSPLGPSGPSPIAWPSRARPRKAPSSPRTAAPPTSGANVPGVRAGPGAIVTAAAGRGEHQAAAGGPAGPAAAEELEQGFPQGAVRGAPRLEAVGRVPRMEVAPVAVARPAVARAPVDRRAPLAAPGTELVPRGRGRPVIEGLDPGAPVASEDSGLPAVMTDDATNDAPATTPSVPDGAGPNRQSPRLRPGPARSDCSPVGLTARRSSPSSRPNSGRWPRRCCGAGCRRCARPSRSRTPRPAAPAHQR